MPEQNLRAPAPVMSLQRIRSNASWLRRVGRVARGQMQRLETGERVCFDVCLTIDGLDQQRREQLVSALETSNNTERSKPVGDGLLYLRAFSDGYALDVATAVAVANFSQMLREVGLQDSEILSATVALTVTPNSERSLPVVQESGARARLGRAAGSTGYGLSVASADLADAAARQHHGDHQRHVYCLLTDLGASAADLQDNSATPLPGEHINLYKTDIEDDQRLQIDIDCREIGTGVGALLLTVRAFGPLLNRVSAGSSLSLRALPPASS